MSEGTQQAAVEKTLARKRSFRRALLWIAAFVAFLLLLVLTAGWYLLRPAQLTRLARSGMQHAGIEGELQISTSSLEHLRVEGVRIAATNAACDTNAFFRLHSVDVYYKASRLLRREIVVDSIVIQEPQLHLCWRDSLLLPAWAQPSVDSVSQEETETTQGLGLAKLEAWSLSSKPLRLILRGMQVSASGSHQGKDFALASPELDMSLRLPGIETADWSILDRRQLPTGFLAEFLAQWSGPWSRMEQGLVLALPSPIPEDSLRLELAGALQQHSELDLHVTADSLQLRVGANLAIEHAWLATAGSGLELPRSLSCQLELDVPLQDTLQTTLPAGMRVQLTTGLPDWGSELQLQATLEEQTELRWKFGLSQTLDAPGELLPLFVPTHCAGMLPLQGELRMQAGGELNLASGFAGPQQMRVQLELDSLQLPALDLQLGPLRAGSTASCVIQDTLPVEISLQGEFALADFAMRPAALGLQDLPPRLQQIHCDTLDLLASAGLASLQDSLHTSLDLSLGSLLDADFFLSLGADLPSPQSCAELFADTSLLRDPLQTLELLAALPGWFFFESSRIPLTGLAEGLQGVIRVSAMSQTGQGSWQAEGSLIPDGVELRADEESEWLSLPLHQLAAGLSFHEGEDALQLQLSADPLARLQLEVCESEQGLKLEAESESIYLQNLLDVAERLRVFELPPGSKLQGRSDFALALQLNRDWLPDSASLRCNLHQLALTHMGYRAENFNLQSELNWQPAGARLQAGWQLAQAGPVDWPALWSGLSGEMQAELSADLARLPELSESLPAAFKPLPRDPGRSAELELQLVLQSLGLSSTLLWECEDWRQPFLSSTHLHSELATADSLVRPWPGVMLSGDLSQDLRLNPLAGDTLQLVFALDGLLDQLRYEELVQLQRLHSAIHLEQDLVADPAHLWLAMQLQPPPVDWDLLRSLGRDDPRDTPAIARGWALRVEEIDAMGIGVQQLALDLRAGQGRLDCPRFQCRLLDGEVRGAFQLAGWQHPEYAMWCTLTGVDSRQFRFGRKEEVDDEERDTGPVPRSDRLDAVISLTGSGADLGALDELTGTMRFPELGREVTLNLLYALNQYSPDPNLGRVSKLLNLPGFRYSVETLDFDLAHGFVRPQVALRKSMFSPLPDVSLPMSPLPLGFLVRNFALVEEEIR